MNLFKRKTKLILWFFTYEKIQNIKIGKKILYMKHLKGHLNISIIIDDKKKYIRSNLYNVQWYII